jgi:hypothetical protein
MPYAKDVADSKTPQPEGALASALEALQRAFDRATTAIGDAPSPQQAFEAASALADTLRVLADRAAERRAQAVAQIWEAEQLSLAGLAQRIGVSRARADQILRSSRKRANASPVEEHQQQQATPQTTGGDPING